MKLELFMFDTCPYCQRVIRVLNDSGRTDVELRNITDDTFDITVPVCVSSTFYAWLTLFVGEMSIVRPGHIRDAYAEYLQDAVENVMGQL